MGLSVFNWDWSLTHVSSPFSSIPGMDAGASPAWFARLPHLWVSTCSIRSVGGSS